MGHDHDHGDHGHDHGHGDHGHDHGHSHGAATAKTAPAIGTGVGVILTARAQEKVKSFIAEEDKPELKALRVFVEGGGCAGFQYDAHDRREA